MLESKVSHGLLSIVPLGFCWDPKSEASGLEAWSNVLKLTEMVLVCLNRVRQPKTYLSNQVVPVLPWFFFYCFFESVQEWLWSSAQSFLVVQYLGVTPGGALWGDHVRCWDLCMQSKCLKSYALTLFGVCGIRRWCFGPHSARGFWIVASLRNGFWGATEDGNGPKRVYCYYPLAYNLPLPQSHLQEVRNEGAQVVLQ